MDYTKIPDDGTINKTVEALERHGIQVVMVDSKKQALDQIIKEIPQGSKVTNGSSTTLEQIGYPDLLKSGQQKWINLRQAIFQEADPVKRMELRRKAITEADYFLLSVNAITEDGLLVSVDGTGSRVGAMPFAAKKLIIVSGVNKIVSNLEAAFKRIREYVFPLEDVRMMKMFNSHDNFGKWVIIESERIPERMKLILVKETLGY